MKRFTNYLIGLVNSMGYLFYRFPLLYDFMLKIVHRGNLEKRYKIISKEIGKNKKVLDIGCGTCLILEYMDDSSQYIGFELNKRFRNYALKKYREKKKNLKVMSSDFFNFDKYPIVDIILVCDVLHHIYPRHKELLSYAIKKSKKTIVCEPRGERMGFVYPDFDGINLSTQDRGPNGWKREFFYKKDLINFFKAMGAKKIKIIGNDVIATFIRP